MLYDVKTPTEYFDALEPDWRKEKVEQLSTIIKGKVPDLEEGISYKMLSYGKREKSVFHLNAQKNYVCLYVGDIAKVDPDGILLKGLNHGKGCIRFKKTDSIPETRIDEFIQEAANIWKKGGDLSC